MMKKTKVIDKWKLKKWYSVLAPAMFDQQELCELAAGDEKTLLHRVLRIGLHELVSSGSQSTMFTTLLFRITSINEGKAATALIGQEVAPSYLRTFARRGKTLIHMAVDGKTKDDQGVRVKVIAITAGKVSETTLRNIRKIIVDRTRAEITARGYDELMQDILYGKLVSRLFNELKKVTAMRRVEIRKTEKKEVFA